MGRATIRGTRGRSVTVDAQQGTLGELSHIGMVVHDIEAAIERLSRLGVRGWGPVVPLEVPDRNAEDGGFRVRVSFAPAGPIQFEPEGPCPMTAFLEARGDGVEHFGYSVDDIDATVERATSSGMKVELTVADENGTAIVFLSDSAMFGVHIELVRREPSLNTEGWFSL